MSLVALTRETTQGAKAAFVLMHGLGSDERDMFGLATELHDEVEIICVRAPYSYGPGYAWFDIGWTPQGLNVNIDQFWESVDWIAGFLATLPKENLIVGGFSQGAMMTVGLMHRYPGLFEHAVLLSGRGINTETPEFAGQVFQAHGTFDDVIRITEADALRNTLKPLGDRYEFHEYEMGHSVCEQEIQDLNTWLSKRGVSR
jgi:phospholipase/carboxylesterase